MTDETPRCEPPPEWRERIASAIHEGLGPNWAYCNYGGDEWNSCRYMLDDAADKVLAIVTPPATVAALVEALEGLMHWHPAKDTISRMGLKPEPAEAAYEAACVALALYRGAGR